MPYTKNFPLILSIVASALLLNGCMIYTKEISKLAKTTNSNGWIANNPYSRTLEGINYGFLYLDNGSKGDIRDPSENLYWIKINLHSYEGSVRRGKKAVIYNSNSATLTINGQMFHALPKIWNADPTKYNSTGRENLGPMNLNSSLVFGGETYYIAFPVPTPAARDRWRVAFGTITIDGIIYELPEAESEFTDGYWTKTRLPIS